MITSSHRPCGFPWPAFSDLQPVLGSDRARFIGVTADTTLHAIDLDAGTIRVIGHAGLELARPMLRLSRDAQLAAVVDEHGARGAVIDLAARRTVMPLARDEDGEIAHCVFPVAFVERDRTLLALGSQWNRLDLVDPRTGENLTARDPIEHGHALDYFHCGLAVSPDQAWIVDAGWVWHPYGQLAAWSIDAWLANPYESEDGPTLRTLAGSDFWDGPLCWVDDRTVAVYGTDAEEGEPPSTVRLLDVVTGALRGTRLGPSGDLVFDRELISIDGDGTAVWGTEGALFRDPTMTDACYHPSAKLFVSRGTGTISTLRGGSAQWNRGHVTALAARIARERTFDDLPVLGDALEAEGCDDAALVAHCHARTEHADRCWVLDRLTAADR